MKRLILILIILLAVGCATTDLENRVKVLEDRANRVEMMVLSGSAAANFFPSRDVDWEETGEAGGDLDYIPTTAELDISYLVSLAEANYAKCASSMCNATLNFFSPYILEDSADSEDFPWVVEADDARADDFISKPFDIEDLALRLKSAIRIGHLTDPAERLLTYMDELDKNRQN